MGHVVAGTTRLGKPFRTTALVLLALIYGAPIAHADAARGLVIAREMKQRERDFGNYTADLKMVLLSSSGGETLRLLHVKTLEVKNDGDKSLAIFDAPADVKGTAFLSHTHIASPDDQWLYLPALKRIKRIAPANKTAPFMGSEFSYEDLASPEVEKFTYDYQGDDTYDGHASFKLERRPVDPHSGYSRQIVWVDQAKYVALKIEYYDRKGAKLKTFIARDFRQYLGRYWRMGEASMDNHRSGKRSIITWSNYHFRQPLHERDFLPASVERMR